ncbi:coiled-coil domain-containing protein [Cohnella algarum]|uniref:coiled-coil domain-containing protein n=1 Tax=Cohnella algarum TaxID=2044859 RepID=UPI0019679E09|nr:hypothetical protein [Cohnella algarum]MBN2983354.1 hypothetical protein [Cohnella algarum]
MRRLIGIGLPLLLLLAALTRTGALVPVYADPAEIPEQTRELLEKSLSVTELEREIERIGSLRTEAERDIIHSETELARQEIEIAAHREKAGRALRSYYMGQKDILLSGILNAGSLSELLRTWELMELVFRSDREALLAYQEEYDRLRQSYEALAKSKTELSEVENALIAQRDRITALRQEVDEALAGSGQEAYLRQLMNEMQAYWRNVGLYEVREHFRALSKAMGRLPDWIQQNPGIMKTSGLKATITVTDEQLNEFIRSEDGRFEQFEISFVPGKMVLEGDNGSLSVRIEGHYTLENEPQNAILFHVDKLVFNGLELPDTTRADLEREFDLGFYPQRLIKYVTADTVDIQEGELVVGLKIGK